MDRVPDGGVGWRVHISKKLQEMGIGVLNPCDKPTSFAKEDAFFRDRIERFKKSNNFESVKSEMRDIAAIDLRMVDIAHFVIMDIDIDVHMCGSYHEAFVAVAQKKPLLIMCQQGKQNVPNWLFGVVPHEHMFGSWSELIEYIHHINEDEEVEDLNRWRFFDWEKVYG
tara:strand:+ start:4781 stop:5284 length:504 start_codon:yes stop_codon:yes gene_type:complete